MERYCTYILTNYSRTLYIGVTDDLERRVYEHKNKLTPGFTSKYNISELVYLEEFDEMEDAIAREKQLKRWVRAKKVALIETLNPTWQDLSMDWFEPPSAPGTKGSSTSSERWRAGLVAEERGRAMTTPG